MNVFDWLSNMEMPGESKFDVIEVRFKNGRKDFYRNSDRIRLVTGDAIYRRLLLGYGQLQCTIM